MRCIHSYKEYYLKQECEYFNRKLNRRRKIPETILYRIYKSKIDNYLSKLIKLTKSQKDEIKVFNKTNIFTEGDQKYMTKSQSKLRAFGLIEKFGSKARTKFNNINGKTGQYDVPIELFQKRTSRKNRVLISWKSVRINNLTIEQLKTFEGGVTVEFINEDYFTIIIPTDPSYHVFNELKNRLGSDDIVSSIISIRSESGSSSSQIQRANFALLINNTEVTYQNNTITLTEYNWRDYVISKVSGKSNMYNDGWSGFLYVNIRGGQQDTLVSHTENITIFNPAQEYLKEDIGLDLDFVMVYFALLSIDEQDLVSKSIPKSEYYKVLDSIKFYLESSKYSSAGFEGNLLDYCHQHPSVRIDSELSGFKLYDPIQHERIHIGDFDIDDKQDCRNLDFTHNESVNKGRYYWDIEKNCILSPSRPTNVFWSKHLSNMMQQDSTLEDYFRLEEERVERRRRLRSI